ncbi:hypothetical protein N7454_003971 [Penicillium verhagenii]|nr:hypothetical protein N7454_003971 [Penicillium verhagenii]
MAESPQPKNILNRIVDAFLNRHKDSYPPTIAYDAAVAAQKNESPLRSGDVESQTWKIGSLHPETLIPANDKLLIFRALTGIDSVPALTKGGYILRSAPNVGIYTRVVRNEAKAARAYRFFNNMINVCLGVQMLVAAALTALGAASGPHAAITAFGAINTVVAGILTYLRGSGLPDRLKSYQNKWNHVREYIEQREREFCLLNCDLDVQQEVFTVETMYQDLKSEMESSSSSGDSKKLQPDDPKHRRSLFTVQDEHNLQRASVAPVKPPTASQAHHEDTVAPVTVSEVESDKP